MIFFFLFKHLNHCIATIVNKIASNINFVFRWLFNLFVDVQSYLVNLISTFHYENSAFLDTIFSWSMASKLAHVSKLQRPAVAGYSISVHLLNRIVYCGDDHDLSPYLGHLPASWNRRPMGCRYPLQRNLLASNRFL